MKKITTKTFLFIILCFTIVTACTLCLSKNNPDTVKDTDGRQNTSGNTLAIFGAEDQERVRELLRTYSVADAAANGCFVVVHGDVEGDSKKAWDAFYTNVTQGKDAAIIIIQYTIEGDPILNYVSFKNGSFFSVTDVTRDAWSGPNPYSFNSYKFLHQFETEEYITVILSDIDYAALEDFDNDTEANRDKSVYLFSVWIE